MKKVMKKILLIGLATIAMMAMMLTACKTEEHEHSWSEWTVVNEATCTEQGTNIRSCACGEMEEQKVSAKGHVKVTDEAVAATCTEGGLTEGKHCSVCNEIIQAQKVVSAKGHVEVTDKAVAPTCTKTGLTEGKHCFNCNEVIVKQETVAETGHSEVVDSAVPPTCAKTGLTEGKHCSVCKEITVPQIVIPANGHKEVVDGFVASSCIENGLTEGKHCSVCDAVLISQNAIPANGHSYENKVCVICGKDQEYSLGLKFISNGDGTCYVSGVGSCEDEEIIIPVTAPNKDIVVKIGAGAFSNCGFLKSVIIPDCVTSIDKNAFSGCTALALVVFAENTGLTTIGESSFEGCTSLVSIAIPGSVTTIGKKAFSNCTVLNKITFAENNSLTTLGAYAFYGCSSIESMTVPSGIASISDYTFAYCTSLMSVTFDEDSKLTYIGKRAFSNCYFLTTVTLPKELNSIDFEAFGNCYRLVEIINRSSINIVAGSAENGYLSYRAKEIHSGDSRVDTKDDFLFYTYEGVNYLFGYIGNSISLVLPDDYNGMAYVINDYAFYGCESLESISIPAGVTSIGSRVFGACDSLVNISIDESNIAYMSVGNCIIEKETNTVIAGCKTSVIPTGVTVIGYGAFAETNIESVTIPSSVKTILRYAFYSCDELISVTFEEGSSLEDMSDYVFQGCGKLVSIVIPKGVGVIGKSTFYGCSSLESVQFEVNSVLTLIDAYAFFDCSSIKTISLPAGIKNIGIYAFYGCRALETLTFEEYSKLDSLEEGAFSTCESLVVINFGETTTRWESVKKGTVWNVFTGEYIVHCTNGDAEKVIETDEEEEPPQY